MRMIVSVLLLMGATVVLASDTAKVPEKRYDVTPDLTAYSQDTPKDALASIIKTVENKRIDYLLAHLTEPDWVDTRVQENGGNFVPVVEEAKGKLLDDPAPLKQLKLFQKEGDWKENSDRASVGHKDVADRRVYLRKIDGRWFLLNRYKESDKDRRDK